MLVSDLEKNRKESVSQIKKQVRLYDQVSILYQGKMIIGTVVSIDLLGVKIKENPNNHTYKWKYVLSINSI